jgi:RNA polymerase sigma factor (sigma-70 family)
MTFTPTPTPSPEEQLQLARRAQAGDRGAFASLIMSQGGLVKQIALSYAKQAGHVELDDLIQEGHIAVIDAARWFDPNRGYRFSTYAGDCVRRRLFRWVRARTIMPICPQEPIVKRGCEPPLEGVPDTETPDAGQMVSELLRLLPPLHRHIVAKRHGLDGDERTIKQITNSLGIDPPRERDLYQKAYRGLCADL